MKMGKKSSPLRNSLRYRSLRRKSLANGDARFWCTQNWRLRHLRRAPYSLFPNSLPCRLRVKHWIMCERFWLQCCGALKKMASRMCKRTLPFWAQLAWGHSNVFPEPGNFALPEDKRLNMQYGHFVMCSHSVIVQVFLHVFMGSTAVCDPNSPHPHARCR